MIRIRAAKVGQSHYRGDIDGLRAIAVTSVVAYHAGVPFLTGGYVGVDVFFVISGYLITNLLVAELELTGQISLLEFYARRLRRLMPAAIVVIGSVLLAAWYFLTPVGGEQQRISRSAVAAITFWSNIYFLRQTGGYFDPASELLPLLHTWSLSVEEQFYLVWPFVLMASCRMSSSSSIIQPIRTCLALLCTISFAICVWSTLSGPPTERSAFYLMHMRAWELALGGLAALICERSVVRSIARYGSMLGLVAIISSVFLFNEATLFPGYSALLPAIGSAAVLIGGAFAPNAWAARALSWRPIAFVGLLSYSWYLWHWPLLAISRSLSLGERSALSDLIAVALGLVMGYVSYRFVEQPIRQKRPWPFCTARRTVIASALLIASTIAAAALLQSTARATLAADGSLANRLDRASRDRNPLRSACHGSPPYIELAAMSQCVTGARVAAHRVLVWGDSHADHLMPALSLAGSNSNTSVLQRTFSACPPIVDVVPLRKGRSLDDCVRFNAAVLNELNSVGPERITGIILSARWAVYLGLALSSSDNIFELSSKDSNEEGSFAVLRAGFNKTFTTLTALGIRVVVVAPTPEMRYRTPECLARRSIEFCSVSRFQVDLQRQRVVELMSEAIEGHESVRLWDPVRSLCDGVQCRPIDGETVLYLDDDHLTASAAAKLTPAAEEAMHWLIGVAAPQ